MASRSSLDGYVGKAVGHYSSLFTLPSHTEIILLLFAAGTVGGVLGVLLQVPSFLGFASGLLFGLTFVFFALLSDFVIYHGCMKTDPIFNLRRCSSLSLFSCVMWFSFVFVGSVLSVFLRNPNVWVKLFLLGFCAVLILRLLVLSTASFASRGRIIFSSLLQPVSCGTTLLFMGNVLGYSLNPSLPLFLFLSLPIVLLVVLLFVALVNRVGEKSLGIASLSLFKAFLANWMEDLNAPLEDMFEKLGHDENIEVSMLAFRANKRIKAMTVVPSFHPGPFKNVGSSPLPYMIQTALENKLQCVVSVPHGLSGHNLDLTSQLQNQRVIDGILGCVDFSTFSPRATPFARTQRDGASASCQVLGDCAYVTLTVAPQTMEDLPRGLGSMIVKEAEKRGLSSAILVDAHNSIDGPFDAKEVVEPLRKAAVECLERVPLHERFPFGMGAARVVPKEFSVEEGMGPGGITVFVVKVGDRETAYVTVDGNNMVSGLREKILLALRERGIVDGEVLTTDTHMVNGVVLAKRGYHPIGEAIDQAKLIDYVREAASAASKDVEPAEVSWRVVTIPKVKVIGERQIGALCLTVEEAARLSKKLAIFLFSMAGVLLTALLILI